MGKQVFAAAKVKGRILIVPDATHNDVAAAGGAEYWQWLQAALGHIKKEGPARTLSFRFDPQATD
jgi:hypothetical protein